MSYNSNTATYLQKLLWSHVLKFPRSTDSTGTSRTRTKIAVCSISAVKQWFLDAAQPSKIRH